MYVASIMNKKTRKKTKTLNHIRLGVRSGGYGRAVCAQSLSQRGGATPLPMTWHGMHACGFKSRLAKNQRRDP